MKTYLTGITLALVAFAPTAQAALDVITTYAQRRAQNIQDVPVSVTAISGDELERGNVRSAVDYLQVVPNVSFTEDGQSGKRGLGLSIRGINTLVSGENAFVNSIGVYLDEFSVGSVPNQVANPFLPDMETIEVLRGPQGTYFGRNSLGGALNLKTRNPTDEYEGYVSGGYETYDSAGDTWNITGVINVPVSDTFRLRGVALYEDGSGKVENITPGGEPDSGHEYIHLRGKLDWDITNDTSALLTIMWSDEDQGLDETVPSGVLDLDTVDTFGVTSSFDPGTGFWPDNRNKVAHDAPETNELETTVIILDVEHRFSDDLVLKWISGVIDSEQFRRFDNDLLPIDLIRRTNTYEGTSYTTELRLESTGEEFDWVLGGMYASDDQEQDNNVAVGSDPTATFMGAGFLPPFPEGLGLALNNKNFEVDSFAIFGDLTWHLSDQLDLIVGARWTSDDVTNEITGFGIAPTCGCPPGPGFFESFANFQRPTASNEESFDGFTPRVVLRYQATDDVGVYASVSKGYKAGGTSVGNDTNNMDAPLAFPFKEEEVWNYELGMKAELLDNRLRINGAIFQMEWEDLQIEAFRFLTPGDLSSNFEETQNVDEAEAFGVELEALAAVSDNLTIGGTLGYLDTEITSNSMVTLTGSFDVDLRGLELPKSPELSFTAFAEYRTEIGGNEWWARGEFVHRDGQYSDAEGLTNQQTTGPSPSQGLSRSLMGEFPYLSPDYDLVNLRGGVDYGENWSFAVYIQNATDEEYYTGTQENFGLSGIRLKPHPRTIGGSATFRF